MIKRNFVIRTIRNGQVKINGRIFEPSNLYLEYDGRLDGVRYAFGLYWHGEKMAPAVELWGLEDAYRAAANDETWEKYCTEHPSTERPECVDGYYPWAFWHTDEGF